MVNPNAAIWQIKVKKVTYDAGFHNDLVVLTSRPLPPPGDEDLLLEKAVVRIGSVTRL